jgi:hypothetical protein
MPGTEHLVRHLPLHAALAAAMAGAILALIGLVFATFLGFAPSPLTLALVVAAVALVCAAAAGYVVLRVARVRQVLGLAPRAPAPR